MAEKFTDDRDPSGLVWLAKVIDEMGVSRQAHERNPTMDPRTCLGWLGAAVIADHRFVGFDGCEACGA